MDTKQSPTNLGLSFGGVSSLVVFPTHFNPNNSLLISLQISLPFMCTPALKVPRTLKRIFERDKGHPFEYILLVKKTVILPKYETPNSFPSERSCKFSRRNKFWLTKRNLFFLLKGLPGVKHNIDFRPINRNETRDFITSCKFP